MINVLIVDDSAAVRLHLWSILESDPKIRIMGAVGNGEEAVRFVEDKRPDVITMDIDMPKMNGLEFLDSLKAHADIKTTPVVILTNLASDKDAEVALSKGAVKYIVKSEHDPKEVVNMVKEILAGYTRDEVPKASN